jgi:hypothetical protein
LQGTLEEHFYLTFEYFPVGEITSPSSALQFLNFVTDLSIIEPDAKTVKVQTSILFSLFPICFPFIPGMWS